MFTCNWFYIDRSVSNRSHEHNEGVDLTARDVRYQAEFGERGGAAGVGLTMHP